MTNTCEFFTRLKLNICEKRVPIKISKLVVRVFHTYRNVTYSCDKIRSVNIKVQQCIIKINKVLIFPFIALTYRDIARRLCERTFTLLFRRNLHVIRGIIKFPFKRKGLPSCSASLHVKAKKYTCASDFPTLPRFFVQTLNTIKHFIVNLKKTIVN